MSYEFARNLLSDAITPRKTNMELAIMEILSSFNVPSIQINFSEFFKNALGEDIFIFPFNDQLYALLQRNWAELEEIGILHWNEIDLYHNLIPHEEQLLKVIPVDQPLYRICKHFFSEFRLYEIPFYFIALIRELFIPTKYGKLAGNWRIKIHPDIKLFENRLTLPPLQPDFQLRDYQENAIIHWHNNQEMGTIAIATAGGKTLLGIRAICDLHLTALIVVPTSVLLEQWREDLIRFSNIPRKQIGLFYGKKHELKPILIGTYESITKYIDYSPEDEHLLAQKYASDPEKLAKKIEWRKRIANYLQRYYSLLILDEAHRAPAPQFRKVALYSKALRRIALSATVARYDHNENLLFFAAGKQIFTLSYIDLCKGGWVVPFFHATYNLPLSEDSMEYYRQSDKEGRRRMSFFNERKLECVREIANLHSHAGHQMLIFTAYVSSAFAIYDALINDKIRVDLVLSKKNQVRKSTRSREAVIDAFKNKELDAIISTTVLDEGFNVPDCRVAIIVNNSQTPRQMVQRIGRIVRKSEPGKVAYIYELVTIGNQKIITLDEGNFLLRNQMCDSLEYYLKTRETLSPDLWTFNYPLINDFAEKQCKFYNIIPLRITPRS